MNGKTMQTITKSLVFEKLSLYIQPNLGVAGASIKMSAGAAQRYAVLSPTRAVVDITSSSNPKCTDMPQSNIAIHFENVNLNVRAVAVAVCIVERSATCCRCRCCCCGAVE